MTATALTFVIHGETITETARQHVLEGRFDLGYELLMDGLEGMTGEYALNILRGDYRLTGSNNDVEMVVDDTDDGGEYKRELQYLFDGCMMIDGRPMQPYAVVTTWGPEDFNATVRGPVMMSSGSDYIASRYNRGDDGDINMAGRCLYYAADPQRDIVKQIDIAYTPPSGRPSQSHFVLFKDVFSFPLMLITPCRTAAEAFAARLKHDDIRECGYDLEYSAETYADREVHTTPYYDAKLHFTSFEKPVDKPVKEIPRSRISMPTEEELKENERKESERAAKLQENLIEWRKKILDQAAGNFIDLSWTEEDGSQHTVQVPRAPFENWSIWRTDGANLAMPWETVCPSGLKMMNDDPYHTDWIVGAGLPLDWMEWPDKVHGPAAYDLQHKVQEELLGFRIPVLCGTGEITGKIVHLKKGDRLQPGFIGVIANAGPDYVEAAYDAIKYGTALITEQGGAMAHLVTVGRADGLRLIRVADARKKLPEGTVVDVDCSKGELSVRRGKIKTLIG